MSHQGHSWWRPELNCVMHMCGTALWRSHPYWGFDNACDNISASGWRIWKKGQKKHIGIVWKIHLLDSSSTITIIMVLILVLLHFLPVYLLLVAVQAQWWYRCLYGCRLERYCKTEREGEEMMNGVITGILQTVSMWIIQTKPKLMTSVLKYYPLLNKNIKN